MSSVKLSGMVRIPLVRRPRFILRTLVLLFVVSLVGSNFYLRWKYRQELQGIERLRGELGVLVIDDPSRFYVREMPTFEPLSWRWRIYVPPGERALHVGVGRISETGTSTASGSGHGPGRRTRNGVTSDPMQGEYTLTARIERDQLGQWQLVVRYPDGSMRYSIMPRDANWLIASDDYYEVASRWKTYAEVAGGGEQMQTFAADDTVILLRLRAPDASQPTGHEPCDGVMVWFEKQALRKKDRRPPLAPQKQPLTKPLARG